MQYNRKISKIINDIVSKYYPYDVRYGDARSGGHHRIKYQRYAFKHTPEYRKRVEKLINDDLKDAGIKVKSAKFFLSRCYYPRDVWWTFAVHLDKNDCYENDS